MVSTALLLVDYQVALCEEGEHTRLPALAAQVRERDVVAKAATVLAAARAAGVYVVAMIALGVHLYHGIWSLLQTLGLSHPRYENLRRGAAGALAALVVVGNVSIPIAALAGWLPA